MHAALWLSFHIYKVGFEGAMPILRIQAFPVSNPLKSTLTIYRALDSFKGRVMVHARRNRLATRQPGTPFHAAPGGAGRVFFSSLFPLRFLFFLSSSLGGVGYRVSSLAAGRRLVALNSISHHLMRKYE